MGYLWPPSRWWPRGEEPAPEGPLCERCGRRNYAGQPLHKMGANVAVCIDCFCFLTGIDSRDPIEDPTARSGDPRYVSRHRRGKTGADHGAPSWPCPRCGRPEGPVLGVCGCSEPRHHEHLARKPDLPDAGYERPLLAPLPPNSPRWARLLHWLGVNMLNER